MKHKIYTDGSGDGRMAWYNETTGENWSGQQQGLTNNEAEYIAVQKALEAANATEIEIVSDSKLVVNQLNRQWHIKDERMREFFDKIHKLIQKKGLKIEFSWVPREKNPAGKYLG